MTTWALLLVLYSPFPHGGSLYVIDRLASEQACRNAYTAVSEVAAMANRKVVGNCVKLERAP